MKNYIVTLIGVALICGIVGALSPEGKGGSLKKHVNLVMSLCVLCILISPLGSVISSLGDIEIFGDGGFDDNIDSEYEEIYKNNLGKYTSESIAEESEKMLCDNFSLDEEDIEIRVTVEIFEESFNVTRAELIIYPSAIAKDPRKMKEFLENLINCECEIIYDKKVE